MAAPSESKDAVVVDVSEEERIRGMRAARAALLGSINALFTDKKAGDFDFAGDVIEIDSNMALEEAFDVLLSNHIQSAPVYDMEKKKYNGFIDTMDMVKYIVKIHSVGGRPGSDLPEFFKEMRNLLAEAYFKTEEALTDDLPHVVALSTVAPVVTVNVGDAFVQAARLLTKDVLGTPIRRVPVVDPATGKISKIISQSAFIAFLHEGLKAAPSVVEALQSETISSTGLGQKAVLTVSEDDMALKALEIMAEHNISGVPIVDEDGKMIGHISKSDMGVVSAVEGTHGIVGMSAVDFMQKSRKIQEANPKMMKKTRAVVVSLPKDATVYRAIEKLAVTKVHRLYVTEDMKPTGVISLKDLMKLLVL